MHTPRAVSTACLSADEIADLVHGTTSSGVIVLSAHVEGCEPCRQTVAAAVRAARVGDRPVREADELAIGTAIERYVITGLLGEGGMGRVYAAFDPELDRKIALKVLRPTLSTNHAELCARLLREAQAAARLSHPNVVAIYDVGSVGSQVFVAMELVEGATLRGWLQETPRGVRAIVDVFRQAGEGIAAAHAAQLIHRDIKPDNILVGSDGRVRVSDFGLARAVVEAHEPPAPERVLEPPLTRTGAFVGTPAYMAPEQLHGDPVDARADQFSFCVALYEALCGVRPFVGDTVGALGDAMSADHVAEPRGVPRWLRKIVLRGLAIDPAQRHASMRELLDRLARDPSVRVRRIALAGAAVALIGGAIAFAQREPAAGPQPCQDSAQRLVGVWDAPRRHALEAAFKASKRPFADAAIARVSAALDAYANSWVAMHADSCKATHVRGEQSADLLDRRNACLEERRAALAEQVTLFGTADGALVDRSLRAVGDLPDVAACADTKALLALVPLPNDAVKRSQAQTLRAGIGTARALERSARYVDADRALGELRPKVQALGYAPLVALVAEQDAVIGESQHDSKRALAGFERAVLAAEEGGDDVTKARALLGVARVRGMMNIDADRVDGLVAQVRATLARIGGSQNIEMRLEQALGAIALIQAKYADAAPHYERAGKLAATLFGVSDFRTARVHGELGGIYTRLGKFAEADKLLTSTLAVLEAQLGASHPDVSTARGRLDQLRFEQGRYEEALQLAQRAKADLIAVFGPNDGALFATLVDIARAYEGLANFNQALATYQEARDVADRAFGESHPNALLARVNVASGLLEVKRYDEAVVAFRDVIAKAKAGGQAESLFVANAQNGLAQALHDPNEGLVAAQEALRLFRALDGEDHPDTGHAYETVGNMLGKLGRRNEAIAALEHALAIRTAALGADHPDVAYTQFSLAVYLYQAGAHARARALAETARGAFVTSDPDNLKTITTWLAKHP